jgi:hypothetical protein
MEAQNSTMEAHPGVMEAHPEAFWAHSGHLRDHHGVLKANFRALDPAFWSHGSANALLFRHKYNAGTYMPFQ